MMNSANKMNLARGIRWVSLLIPKKTNVKFSSLHVNPGVKSLDLCVQFEVYIDSRKLEMKHGWEGERMIAGSGNILLQE